MMRTIKAGCVLLVGTLMMVLAPVIVAAPAQAYVQPVECRLRSADAYEHLNAGPAYRMQKYAIHNRVFYWRCKNLLGKSWVRPAGTRVEVWVTNRDRVDCYDHWLEVQLDRIKFSYYFSGLNDGRNQVKRFSVPCNGTGYFTKYVGWSKRNTVRYWQPGARVRIHATASWRNWNDRSITYGTRLPYSYR